MTQQLKKEIERHYAETTARLLGQSWMLSDDRENPDFLVSDSNTKFGLEVCQVFNGSDDLHGSLLRRREGQNFQILEAARREYEASGGPGLHLKFLGRPSPTTSSELIATLKSLDLHSKPERHREEFELVGGSKVYAQVTKNPRWYSVSDRAGWVNQDPFPIVAAAIKRKSEKLGLYKGAAGDDVRLLLVADRILNSGKMEFVEDVDIDSMGFSAIYFLSYPESATTLSCSSCSSA